MPLPTPKHANKPLDWFLDGENSRDPIVVDNALRELHGSLIEHGQLQPVGAIDKGDRGLPIWGFRRLASGRLLGGIEKLSVLIYPDTLTPADISILNATENLQRQDNTEAEIFRLSNKLMELNPGWNRKDLAEHLHKDPSTITRWLCPNDLVAEAKQAFLDGKFGFAKAYAIAKSPDQLATLAFTLNGETRDGLERRNRRAKNANTPAVRASKIKLELGNVTVTISGNDLSLDDAIEAVVSAQKEMRKGRDQGLDARTLVAVCRDKAKAG